MAGAAFFFGWVPLPKSEADTSYDLLEDIKKAIWEEPKRYNQATYIRTLRATKRIPAHSGYARCGTAACVAGWTVLMAKPTGEKPADKLAMSDVDKSAAELLGLSWEQSSKLFDGDAMADVAASTGMGMPVQGTLEYAALGIIHIARFQEEHESQLRKHRLGTPFDRGDKKADGSDYEHDE